MQSVVSWLELLCQESKLLSHSPILVVLGTMPRNTLKLELMNPNSCLEMKKKVMVNISLPNTQKLIKLQLLETQLEIHSKTLQDLLLTSLLSCQPSLHWSSELSSKIMEEYSLDHELIGYNLSKCLTYYIIHHFLSFTQ